MTLHVIPDGGPRSARRPIVLLAATLLLAVPQHPAAASADDASSQVSVREEDGLYTVAARFRVDAPPQAVLAVLTDYERIPAFMPGVKSSVVLERHDGHVVVEQDAVSRFMFFSKRVHLMLEVQQEAGVIRFRDRSAASFSRYEGSWHVSPDQGSSLVSYDLVASPSFTVPRALLSRLLKRDSAEMITQLRVEIARSICRADRRS
jgi:carbon monoxide dehydrogenase subunit G